MNTSIFKIKVPFPPNGDQPKAIKKLLVGLKKGMRAQTLLGVTGSGKTFTMANVIASVGKPTLVIAHNKTLAAQLAQEYKEFFPENAVHYFVSYYDYYQPEAYMPTTDTYIEKDAQINEEIDRLRHASTQALLTRKDVIIVASVSCIYGLGSPAEYEKENMRLSSGQKIDRKELLQKLINIHFTRTNADLTPGTFRSIGSLIEIMPVSEKIVWSITMDTRGIESINKVDPVSQKIVDTPESIFIFPAKHFITNEAEKTRAIKVIKKELDTQLKKFEKEGKLLEAERLKRRTTYDLAMIREVGYCNGIENYSRHMSGRSAGSAPDTLLSYFPRTKDGKPDFLTIIDESHVTIPQIGGMYAGDQSRKKTLVEFGFRLPSAMDNRPLRSEEFHECVGQMIFTSATPSVYEKENSEQVVEQVIRPTGLIDPEISIRPILARPNFPTCTSFRKSKDTRGELEDRSKDAYPGQIQDLIAETKTAVSKGGRVIATTLTKKMAEDLSEYLKGEGIKAEYVHSEIKTLERIQILTAFRKGTFDCLVGVNLLREGLDLPEVTLIGILDADKEGFLRSETSLIQIIGRAARNVEGRVILYAEKITGSIERAVSETNRRRAIQVAYNNEHGITPKTIIKQIKDITEHLETDHMKAVRLNLDIDAQVFIKDPQKLLKLKEKKMSKAVEELDFETAAILRDEITMLREQLLK
ncbi:MAG: excinuclease ABC subunit B [Candidatus Yonathbacteria bacterium CG10_big_fil_rev_8_21_14_0_10_43_136]|uniref:UvrABC system protein B n=2 Tax=Parcubacteria group TaxID=1794811 RepID=A0A2M7Q4K1_9BACT|nr:MAG: excinuclease ABC subunit B [Candidatus Nomurabacteria bacterium CG2_30_43_9]PIQ35764.1 MAG: excinuclease ABC subunit B [Candidatus Yonathbacteria bacterium CG17_big_fil_post_rev_8_21_14_2_50_43_9]PIR40780.1 MAG: excinuclease ABC subunit B [Candidatus Yonathbacteria bacterium CG10_big_fil_rev_8_21_14_0_10_43_136]PIX56854.1 MAG: excinuclease ABC subunit B [Candidatus Yonathbacteria bacterium CG_4_10_14_3_um_filter_43_12]PIY58313.1 MAG: excinuclease ABC subunit B [Candidatus Yonathbacteria